jgi:peptidoglycan hydrolase-like protein with peptidoglycan-binding domain
MSRFLFGERKVRSWGKVDWPELRLGERSVEVVVLQYLLRAEGYQLTVDGEFGQHTQDAVVQFQIDSGLTADGMVGRAETWPTLVADHSVQQGSTDSDSVRAAQHVLSVKFGYGIPVDGDFGPGTDAAVRDFQQRASITVNGLVGPVMWRYLLARN